MLNRLFPFLMLLLALVSCGRRTGHDARPVVTASIVPLASFVEAIAGERFAVTPLVPPGAGPETYEPSPRQMVELNASRILFRIGTLGLERTRLEKMAETAPDLLVVDASRGITPLAAGQCAGQAADGSDQHTWTSPANAKIMGRNICKALCRVDSAHAPAYERRLARFEAHADSIDAAIRQRLQSVTHRTFLIAHPALGYFARDYGLRQLSVEADGKEPSPERLAALVEQCRAEGVRVVFVQKEHPGRAARRIAAELGLPVVEIDPLSSRWGAELIRIADALAR